MFEAWSKGKKCSHEGEIEEARKVKRAAALLAQKKKNYKDTIARLEAKKLSPAIYDCGNDTEAYC